MAQAERSVGTEMSLNIERRINLDDIDDRHLLLSAAHDDPGLRQLIESNLSDYLAWFQAPEWREVSGGGLIRDPGHSVRDIRRMLELTAVLRELSTLDGSSAFRTALNNPTQISATILEVDVAKWLITRAAHRSIEIAPTISRKGKTKRPDFRWTTDAWHLLHRMQTDGGH